MSPLKILMHIAVIILLSSCASYHPKKAPCDQYAVGCGQKIKVNQW